MTYTRGASALPVTIALAKDHMRLAHDDEDLIVSTYLMAAAREIEAYAEIALAVQTVQFVGVPVDGLLVLPVGPLADDPAVTINGVPVSTGIAGGRYPSIALPDVSELVAVTYQAGFTTVPDDLQLAVLEQAAFAYDNRGTIDAKPGLTPAAARICARYRRVRA